MEKTKYQEVEQLELKILKMQEEKRKMLEELQVLISLDCNNYRNSIEETMILFKGFRRNSKNQKNLQFIFKRKSYHFK